MREQRESMRALRMSTHTCACALTRERVSMHALRASRHSQYVPFVNDVRNGAGIVQLTCQFASNDFYEVC